MQRRFTVRRGDGLGTAAGARRRVVEFVPVYSNGIDMDSPLRTLHGDNCATTGGSCDPAMTKTAGRLRGRTGHDGEACGNSGGGVQSCRRDVGQFARPPGIGAVKGDYQCVSMFWEVG